MEAMLKGGYSGGEELRQEMQNSISPSSSTKVLDKMRSRNMETMLKQGYSGGEELRRAMATLAGPNHPKEPPDGPDRDGVSPRVPHPPIQLAEGADPMVRELTLAAQRYGRAGQMDPGDFEAIYNHGLALQELALRSNSSKPQQEQLLRQAAGRYEAAWVLRNRSHAALYNWGVALSDCARVVKPADRDEAHALLKQAAEKYAMSLRWNPHNPQALNNWGLVLQELATMQAPAEQTALVQQSIKRFRQAIRLRPDFDRACYNCGTVFYSFACSQQSSITQRLPSSLTKDPEHAESERASQESVQQLFALAAQYVLLAHALQPGKEVYRKSLQVIKPLLPLPHLRAGFLAAAVPCTPDSCRERWERQRYCLDAESFRPVSGLQSSEASPGEARGETAAESGPGQTISLRNITTVKRCLDPSLPPGATIWVGLADTPEGAFFTADSEIEAEGWLDALQLAAHIASINQLSDLRKALRIPEPAAA